MSEPDVRKAQMMKLKSLMDLLRLVTSIMGRSSTSRHLYYAKKGEEYVFFLTHSIGGWYDLKGLPVTLVATTETEPEGDFLEYTPPSEGKEEEYKFVSEIKQSTQSITIPIISLSNFPDFMY